MKQRTVEIIAIVIAIFAILITCLALNVNNLNYIEIGDYSLMTNDNNLVIAHEDSSNELNTDDKIVYITYEKNKLTSKVGIINEIIKNNQETMEYKIKVDNKELTIDESCIIGKYKLAIPVLGTIITFLLTRDGFLLLIVLPLLIISIYELFRFIDGFGNKKTKI